jgi:ATP-dependent RNA helicase DDX10/DBP4
LFSATVTKSLKELARLNLNSPEYIQIHNFDSVEQKATEGDPDNSEQLKSVTPLTLLHHYMEVNIDDKLDMLFSFLKLH